ncbi:hypothetical protein N7U21_01060 [Mycobacterium tuberculosis]|nr:hypothetical protein [Mycobacterium tuberculosis]MCT9145961.1 hypothetical protein [Mycobacterium tuberculosis]
MSNSRRRSLRWSWLLSVLAAVGLGLATGKAVVPGAHRCPVRQAWAPRVAPVG